MRGYLVSRYDMLGELLEIKGYDVNSYDIAVQYMAGSNQIFKLEGFEPAKVNIDITKVLEPQLLKRNAIPELYEETQETREIRSSLFQLLSCYLRKQYGYDIYHLSVVRVQGSRKIKWYVLNAVSSNSAIGVITPLRITTAQLLRYAYTTS